MSRLVRRGSIFLLMAALAVVTACREKQPAPVGDLFAIRSEGLAHLSRGELPEAEAQVQAAHRARARRPARLRESRPHLAPGRALQARRRSRCAAPARSIPTAPTPVSRWRSSLSLTNRAGEARTLLEQLRKAAPRDAHVLYALAQLDAPATDAAGMDRYAARLRDLLGVVPSNLAVRVELIGLLAKRGAADSAVQQLEEVRRTPPELPPEARAPLDSALQLLRAGKLPEARAAVDHLAQAAALTSPYQASLDAVKWVDGALVGRQVLSYAPRDFITIRSLQRNDTASSVRFADVTSDAGLAPGAPDATSVLAAGDVDGDGVDEYLVGARLYRARGGMFDDAGARAGLSLP